MQSTGQCASSHGTSGAVSAGQGDPLLRAPNIPSLLGTTSRVEVITPLATSFFESQNCLALHVDFFHGDTTQFTGQVTMHGSDSVAASQGKPSFIGALSTFRL